MSDPIVKEIIISSTGSNDGSLYYYSHDDNLSPIVFTPKLSPGDIPLYAKDLYKRVDKILDKVQSNHGQPLALNPDVRRDLEREGASMADLVLSDEVKAQLAIDLVRDSKISNAIYVLCIANEYYELLPWELIFLPDDGSSAFLAEEAVITRGLMQAAIRREQKKYSNNNNILLGQGRIQTCVHPDFLTPSLAACNVLDIVTPASFQEYKSSAMKAADAGMHIHVCHGYTYEGDGRPFAHFQDQVPRPLHHYKDDIRIESGITINGPITETCLHRTMSRAGSELSENVVVRTDDIRFFRYSRRTIVLLVACSECSSYFSYSLAASGNASVMSSWVRLPASMGERACRAFSEVVSSATTRGDRFDLLALQRDLLDSLGAAACLFRIHGQIRGEIVVQ